MLFSNASAGLNVHNEEVKCGLNANAKGECVVAVPKEQTHWHKWIRQGVEARWCEMLKVAGLMLRLLRRHPLPSDPNTSLPTPTPAAGATIQRIIEQIDGIIEFVRSCRTAAPFHPGLHSVDAVQCTSGRLCLQLLDLKLALLAGHLPNLAPDVNRVMR